MGVNQRVTGRLRKGRATQVEPKPTWRL